MGKRNRLYVIFKKAQNIPLNEKFLQSFRNNLVEYIKVNPLPSKEEPVTVWRIFSLRLIPALGVAALFIILSGGVSAMASQKSMPGDFLYSVKIASEKLKATLAPAGKPRADFRIRQAYTRMEEIKKLQEKTAENADISLVRQTSRQFSAHLKDALHETQALEKEGMVKEAEEVRAGLALSLKVYKETLKTKEDAGGEDDEVKNLQEEIERGKEESQKKDFEDASNGSIIQEKINSAAEERAEIEKMINDNRGRLLGDVISKVDDRVRDARNKIQEAQEKFDKEDFSGASGKIDDAVNLLRQSKTLIETALIINEESLKEILPQIDTALEKETIDQERGRRGEDEDGEEDEGDDTNRGDDRRGRGGGDSVIM